MNLLARLRLPDGLLGYSILYLVFLYVPVLFLPLFSFNDSIYITFPLTGFTTQWYEKMIESEVLLAALGNSIKVAVSVSVISTILGTLAARAFTRYRFVGRRPMLGLLVLPLGRARHHPRHRPADHDELGSVSNSRCSPSAPRMF